MTFLLMVGIGVWFVYCVASIITTIKVTVIRNPPEVPALDSTQRFEIMEDEFERQWTREYKDHVRSNKGRV